MGRCDPGDQLLLKIQSARNRFKSNESVGLIVMNPTQLIWVQTYVGRKIYHILFKTTNMQKKRDVDCTVRTDVDVTGHTTHDRQLCGQLAYDVARLQRMG
jgi:hypothetical protein